MPLCLRCGNRTSFSSSRLPLLTPWVNGDFSALTGNFQGDQVDYLENLGTPPKLSEQAFSHPEYFFDTCAVCGSSQIVW